MENPNLTKKVIANASEAVKRLNPDLFRDGQFLPKVVEQKTQRPLVSESSGRESRRRRLAGCGQVLRITLVAYLARRLDDDNLAGGFKPLRDVVARWLDIDDSDKFIDWQYGQVVTRGCNFTDVKFERI